MSFCNSSLKEYLFSLVKFTIPPVAILILVVVASLLTGISIGDFTRDPSDTADVSPFIGFVSSIGILFWCATVTICLFTWRFFVHQGIEQEKNSFFLFWGLFTALLMFDDLFLLHEEIIPTYLMEQDYVIVSYGVLLAGGTFYFRRQILTTEYIILLLAMVTFGLSIVIDKFHDLLDALIGTYIIFEDGFKLMGIFYWLVYFWKSAAQELGRFIIIPGK